MASDPRVRVNPKVVEGTHAGLIFALYLAGAAVVFAGGFVVGMDHGYHRERQRSDHYRELCLRLVNRYEYWNVRGVRGSGSASFDPRDAVVKPDDMTR